LPDSAWPVGTSAAQKKAVFDAKAAAAQEHAKAIDARAQAELDEELDLLGEFHKAILEVGKASIERARSSADTVQKASAAILGLYTAILGVVFSVSDNPLPSRGVIPTLFLGLAVVFSTVYLAYLTSPPPTPPPRRTGGFRPAAMERSRMFIEWAGNTVRNRAYWLRAGVIALGVALAFLPAAFVGPLPLFKRIPPVAKATSTAKPDWPPVPNGSSALEKIRYKAEVAEIAAQRSASPPSGVGADRSWWWASILGLLVVLLVPLAIRGDKPVVRIPRPRGPGWPAPQRSA
jgi:hypothetical protein